MRRITIPTVAAAVLFAMACPQALGRSGKKGSAGVCPGPSGPIIAADTQVTVYRSLEPNISTGWIVNACVDASRRKTRLGLAPGCGAPVCLGVRREVLAGTVVAYESFFTGEEEGRWYVAVRDLRSGRLIHHLPTGTPLSRRLNFAGVGPIVDLVVKADGSVAWIAEDVQRSAPQTALRPKSRTSTSTPLRSTGHGWSPRAWT